MRVYAEIVLAGDRGIDVLWLSEPDATKHLSGLVEAGLVRADDDRQRVRVVAGVFRGLLQQLPRPEPDVTDTVIPRKQVERVAFLGRLVSELFEEGVIYDEASVDEILRTVHSDATTVRRYLVDYGLFDRTRDGRSYWVSVDS